MNKQARSRLDAERLNTTFRVKTYLVVAIAFFAGALLVALIASSSSSTSGRLELLQAESETWYKDVFKLNPDLVKEFGVLDVYLDSERDCAIWVFDSWQHFQAAQYNLFDDANILRTGGKGEGETWTLLGSDTTCVGEALNALGNGS